ncbi:VCBS repeat-containing protein [Fulvimarina manganoxydans]|uniref:VCBS repeat-containing protein n=1 Tax=Fulvimarina manganoxydans TaxID=937218 RepID=A0A1W2D4B3_9HYPH|nr:VCBS domain-containing protein [Fulvimarina manganoxydans]SMC92330.1 VCBS repeat-containing protein [Fulvimarina manganoxydans]
METDFVAGVYQRLLLRDPTSAELDAGVEMISRNGEATFEASIADTDAAVELQTIVLPIIGLYQAFLERTPEPAGLEFWTAAIQSGSLTFRDLIESFVTTSEFAEVNPGIGANPTNEDLVNLFYTNILGRVPDDAGYQFWLSALQSGSIQAGNFTSTFIGSTEVQGDIGAALRAYYADVQDGRIDEPGSADSLRTNGSGGGGNVIGGGQPVNHPPVAGAEVPDQTANEDDEFTFKLPDDAFTDADREVLSLKASLADGSALPAWLSFDADTGVFAGIPSNDDVGSLEIVITASDPHGASASQIVNFTVANTNDPAAISGEMSGAVTEDGVLVAGGILTIADPDVGEDEFQSIENLVATYGAFSVASDGIWTYSLANDDAVVQSLNTGQVVEDSIDVVSKDGTATEKLVVRIAGANDDPIAVSDTAMTDEDTAITINVLDNDTDPDSNDTLSLIGAQITNNGQGTVSVTSEGKILYDPGTAYSTLEVGETAEVEITYSVSDEHGGLASAILNVTVAGVADPLLGKTVTYEYLYPNSSTIYYGVTRDFIVSSGNIEIGNNALGNGAEYYKIDFKGHSFDVIFDYALGWNPDAEFNGFHIYDKYDQIDSFKKVDVIGKYEGLIGVIVEEDNIYVNWKGAYFEENSTVSFNIGF